MSAVGLLDTSVFIASEMGRPLAVDLLPDESLVSVITVAELEAGVLAAATTEIRARRLLTAQRAATIAPLSVDAPAARAWARARVLLHERGRQIGVNDLWIASIAMSRDLPVVTRDDDFDALVELGLLDVVRV